MKKPIIEVLKKKIFIKNFVKEIDGKYQKLKIKRQLSSEQCKEIQEYYLKLTGHKVPLSWHRFMYSRTGVYSKKYIPLSVYRSELIGRMNNFQFMDAYADKNVSELLFPDVKQPHTIIRNINGYYYSDGKSVSEEEAIQLCSNVRDMIIKPSLESRGTGVKLLNVENGITNVEGKSIREVFCNYGKNFLVQEKVKQHPAMEALNPTSANTIRLLTYRMGMDVVVLYTVIRIGKAGQVIDNESKGGISAKINEDGKLAKYAYGAPGNDMVEKTDTGITLEGYQIPSYDKVVATAKRSHFKLPYFNMAAWDFCVGVDGEPIMIEWNANPDLSQTANGPAFGDYTEQIFSTIYSKENTRNKYW